ncbi:cold shock domain-containing protein [Psychromonas sp. MB-3u-54]|uniref:cold shock domain-containing protein n=1 Tax=Psychromonas sp. MB-3u-54 TaxID=2058319 RepID=UPI0012FEEDAC|nr:cold shock domain-containing protein [Psychromonas sp. MB-3u-54]
MKGKISQWEDDQDCGFISSEKDGKVFFNISSLKNKDTKPEIGDSVVFVLTTDNKNRLKATKVAIDSLPKTSNSQQNNIEVEPKTINAFDCFLIAVLIFSVTFAEYTYFKTTNIGRSFIFAIPAVIAFIFLGRQKNLRIVPFNVQHVEKPNPMIRERLKRGTVVLPICIVRLVILNG